MVVVMRNGASTTCLSVLRQSNVPFVLASDKTSHPAWTGQREGVSMEDERLQKLLTKYQTWGAALTSQADGKQAA